MDSRLARALERCEAAHREDPRRIEVDGELVPWSVHYHRRLGHWVLRFDPRASLPLRLAAVCQHIRRWEIPRDDFPRDRIGYLKWRTRLKHFHAEVAAGILQRVGYDAETIARVQALLRKEHLKRDPEAQTLEDVVCLVFLENWFADFARQHEPDKIVDIVAKTWKKMSPAGREAALGMAHALPEDARVLVERAVAG